MQLVEILVATSVLGLVMAPALLALQQGLHLYADGTARVETQQAARIALERIAHDVRMAGFGGAATDFDAVAVAEPSALTLQLDLNRDGAIAGPGETITWRLTGGILRRAAGGGAQPIVNGVRDFTLTYVDGNGAPATTPGGIRAVTVTLTTEPTHTASAAAAGITTTLRTHVTLRNR